MNRATITSSVAAATLAAMTAAASAGVRDVQIQDVNTSTGVVTLRNLGPTDQPLDAYRMCSADDNEVLRYSTGGLADRTIPAGGDFFIHWNNDAPAGDPQRVNISSLGGNAAGPLDNGPFGLAVYWRTPFGTPANMADYVQWTDDLANPDNASADARAGTANSGGLWTAVDDWVVTNLDTTAITLLDDTGGELHGPDDYGVDGGVDPCPEDLDGSGAIDFGDILAILAAWGNAGGVEDLDGNGTVDFGDILEVLAVWGPCPA